MRLAGALLLSVLLGCDGSLEPGDVAGDYDLTTVDASPLPYLLHATVECDERLTRGTLTLAAEGDFTLRLDHELDCAGSVVPHVREYAGVFVLDGRRIFLNGAASDGLRINYEGQSRGTGFVLVTTTDLENPVPALELGFELTPR